MVESSKVVAYCRSQGSIVADRPYMQIFALIPETGCLCLCMGPIVEMHTYQKGMRATLQLGNTILWCLKKVS